jgi:hypothetical protein
MFPQGHGVFHGQILSQMIPNVAIETTDFTGVTDCERVAKIADFTHRVK